MSVNKQQESVEGQTPQIPLVSSFSSQEVGLFNANDIINNRAGDVLLNKYILKSDHFPGCQNKELQPLIDGAPNYRKVDGLEVYGVAIPTMAGLRRVLDHIGAAQGGRKVVWFNMREEPLIYINGRPYVVREVEHPFLNLEYTGINRERVESMETRLKTDVLDEAKEYKSMVLVTDETDDFQMIYQLQGVTQQDVQTPLEVYAELKEDGYDVEYLRVPVTDEKAPKERDFQLLIEKCWDTSEDAALMFNCQMGRGRTTTGMIIASLVQLKKLNAFPPLPQNPMDFTPEWFCGAYGLGEFPDGSPRAGQLSGDEDEARLMRGNYGVIRSLVRVLANGTQSKAVLDKVVDACSDMQNLREAITKYRARMFNEVQEDKRQTLLTLCQQYLERYYILIAFASYLGSPAFHPKLCPSNSPASPLTSTDVQQNGVEAVTFVQWMQARPELRSVLNRLLDVNPLLALEMHKALEGEELASPGVYFRESEEEIKPSVVAQREGSVLGQHTILKADHFPGIHQPGLDQVISGAPNYRPASGYRVYGVGIPSGEGIRNVLQQVQGKNKRKVVWHNMREEPVVYIREEPFVLREEDRPYKNMREYKGINASRLENMEERLKEDILSEASRYDGQILVMKERPLSFDHGRVFGELYDEWVRIENPDEVRTPKELYEVIAKEGDMNVSYHRVPITDGTSPEFSDIQFISENCQKAGPESAFVFSCQLGKGRTTVGMVLGCMLSVHLKGKSLSCCLEAPAVLDLEELDISRSSTLNRVDSEDLEGSTPTQSEYEVDLDIDQDMELAEDRVYREGGYKGVRRVVRVLERGEASKEIADRIIDRCDTVINLRTIIRRYRRPRQSFRFYRPEIQVRAQAFKRGAAYLSRYCLVITFAAYLQKQAAKQVSSFTDWVQSQAALSELFRSIQYNPGTALDILPTVVRIPSQEEEAGELEGQVSLAQERVVLARRRGNILTKRTILKSYHSPDVFNDQSLVNIYGISDLRQVKDLPIYTTANPSIKGLRGLLDYLNAGPGGSVKLLITDLREEPVLFIQGQPYMQRDIELPVASHHHAGIYYMQLQYVEQQLQADVVKEAEHSGGKILIHRELPPVTQQQSEDGGISNSNLDVTSNVDIIQNLSVAPFWVEVNDSKDVLTPLQVHAQLKSEGFQVSYRRIPLSRARTPVAKDLDHFHEQASTRLDYERRNLKAVHLIISRTAQGSSQRFGSSLLTTHVRWATNRRRSRRNSFIESYENWDGRSAEALKRMPSMLGEHRELLNLCQVLPSGTECKAAVDIAIGQCEQSVGNIVEDIERCKRRLSAVRKQPGSSSPGQEFAARQLGLHYLQRYFLLITYRCYLHQSPEEKFSEWFDSQQELQHLLQKLSLDS